MKASSPRPRRPPLQIPLIALAVAGAGVLFLGLLASSREPRFEGRSVFYWMLDNRSSDLSANPGLTAIGTNAVPYLAKALNAERTAYDKSALIRLPALQRILAGLGIRGGWTIPSADIRRAAGFSLLAFGFEARSALPQLHTALLQSNAGDRQLVINCLCEMGPLPESIPVLIQAWPLATNEDWIVRDTLLYALGSAGSNAAVQAMPLVVTALDGPIPDVGSRAAATLAAWGQPAAEAIPKLVKMIGSTNLSAATAAADALGRITNRADGTLPSIRRLLTATDEYAQAVGAITLWRLGGEPDESRLHLESLLSSKEAKGVAANFLGQMGSAARSSVPALLKASHDDTGSVIDMYDRAQCARAVLRIQGESNEAVHVLEAALEFKPNNWVRHTVAGNIGNLGPSGIPLMPALEKALNDPDRLVRHYAAVALAKLEALKGKRGTPHQ